MEIIAIVLAVVAIVLTIAAVVTLIDLRAETRGLVRDLETLRRQNQRN